MWDRLFFILLILVGYRPVSFADEVPPILKKLNTFKGSVLVYSNFKRAIVNLSDLPTNFRKEGYSIVKDKTGVYVLPHGTGRIYKLHTSSSTYSWQRIDSTYLTGYNFNSIGFKFDSVFYSFGGRGFWITNGILRNFNVFSRQWEAVSLSEDIHWNKNADGFYYLDTSASTLTVRAISSPSNEVLKRPNPEKPKEGLYQLDVKNGNWKRLGIMKDSTFEVMATLPWGLLVNKNTVLDMHQNRYFKLSNAAQKRLLAILSSSKYPEPAIASFAVDSVLYVGNEQENYDSLQLSQSDLVDTGMPIYTAVQSESSGGMIEMKSMLIAGLGFLVSFLGLLLYKTKKKQPSPELVPSQTPLYIPSAVAEPETEKHPTSFRSTRILELLEVREKSLLEFLFHHSADERLTSIQEINKVIGVQHRSVEIQKRMRSDLIGSINQKMGIITKDKKAVINKKRSEFDKRTFEYFINPVHMKLVEKILGIK